MLLIFLLRGEDLIYIRSMEGRLCREENTSSSFPVSLSLSFLLFPVPLEILMVDNINLDRFVKLPNKIRKVAFLYETQLGREKR